jgi:hypothetical protein
MYIYVHESVPAGTLLTFFTNRTYVPAGTLSASPLPGSPFFGDFGVENRASLVGYNGL